MLHRWLTSMKPGVFLERPDLREGLLTDLAAVGFVPFVTTKVGLPGVLVEERLWAEVTLPRPLTCHHNNKVTNLF